MNNFFKIDKRCVTLLEVLISLVLTVIILTTLTFFYGQVGMIGSELDKTVNENFRFRYVETRLAGILPKVVAENNKNQDFVFFSVDDDPLSRPGSQSLIFTFENGVSLDKEIANHALGRIYLEKNGNLMLAYWPSPKRWQSGVLPEMKREVLLEGVDSVKFEFFIPPDKGPKKNPSKETQEPSIDKETTKEKEPSIDKGDDKNLGKENKEGDKASAKPSPEPKNEWRREAWLSEYETLPAMIRVILTLDDVKNGNGEKGKRRNDFGKNNHGKKTMIFAYPFANSKDHVIYGGDG